MLKDELVPKHDKCSEGTKGSQRDRYLRSSQTSWVRSLTRSLREAEAERRDSEGEEGDTKNYHLFFPKPNTLPMGVWLGFSLERWIYLA